MSAVVRKQATQDRLKELLCYDPSTGVFIWKVDRGGMAKADTVAGTIPKGQYCIISIDSIVYPAHRLAWLYVHGEWPKDDIDHINNNRSDNRISNLREATRSQNLQNASIMSNNTSGYKGVFWIKNKNRWSAQIKINGKRRRLGVFKTALDAHKAYCLAAKEGFGEFANYGPS